MLKPLSLRTWNKAIDYRLSLAKTEIADGTVIPGMSVYQHSLVTGFVAREIAQTFPLLVDGGLFPPGYDLMAAIHDLGKVSPTFQKKIINALDDRNLRDKLLDSFDLGNYPDNLELHHSIVSYAALLPCLGKKIAYIAGVHHGGLKGENDSEDELCGGKSWQDARLELLSAIERTFSNIIPETISESEITFLAGLTTVSDWISSSIGRVEFESNGVDVCRRKVFLAGFKRHYYKQGLSFQDVFGFPMRVEQKSFIESISGAGVYILEAGMGVGKTEAALYASYKLLSEGKADGLYFALPTKLTARQIHKRVDDFLQKILVGEELNAKLVFSNSFLHECVYGNGFADPSWFDSKKRLILAPFGVGTIDQALMSVLSVRHSAVRAFGLAGKVVIIDEVHSYDSYTGTLITYLIKLLVELKATVIILSATLRKESKAELLGLSSPGVVSCSYPCVTREMNGKLEEWKVNVKKHKKICLDLIHDNLSAVDDAVAMASDGKYVLWIENTVAEAQSVYKKIAARCRGTDIRFGLLHSRFLGKDRAEKEMSYISAYGKDGWEKRGGYGYILVGTQILEQSLDLDADILFTRIAPIDMIIQRMGRVWRHEHAGRRGDPSCIVLAPGLEDVLSNEFAFGLSGSVYARYVLYRTLSTLTGIKEIDIPNDITKLIEKTYDDHDEYNKLPNRFKRELSEKKTQLLSLASLARMNIGKVLPDEESTRYGEIKTRNILIVADISESLDVIRLVDGTCLELGKCVDARSKAEAALMLEENILSIPVSYCPSNIQPLDSKSILSRFVYLSSNEEERLIVLVCSHGVTLSDLYGNEIKNYIYSKEMGYMKIEEV